MVDIRKDQDCTSRIQNSHEGKKLVNDVNVFGLVQVQIPLADPEVLVPSLLSYVFFRSFSPFSVWRQRSDAATAAHLAGLGGIHRRLLRQALPTMTGRLIAAQRGSRGPAEQGGVRGLWVDRDRGPWGAPGWPNSK